MTWSDLVRTLHRERERERVRARACTLVHVCSSDQYSVVMHCIKKSPVSAITNLNPVYSRYTCRTVCSAGHTGHIPLQQLQDNIKGKLQGIT
jgi:ferredoxin